jgi:chorismate-pyruvate lyase
LKTDPSHHLAEVDLYTRSASRLAALFFNHLDEIGRFEPVAVDDMPRAARTLLAHHDHMTVALEAFHNSPVAVQAVAEWRDEASYARCSLLNRKSDGAIIQFGMMRIWLADLPEDARREITDDKQPLGRVLIEHNVLREVEVIALWRISPGPVLRKHLELPDHSPLYGRSAQILVDERPTVQVLEIVRLDTGR